MKTYNGQIEYNLKRMKRSSPSEEFFKAVKDNNFLQLRDLFKRNIGHDIDVNAKDKDGNTLLHYASQYGHQRIVEFLFKKKILDSSFFPFTKKVANVDAVGKDGKTPLHLAAREGHEGVVKTLLEKRANIDAKDKNDWTPLHEGAFADKLNVVKLLIKEHADIKARNKDGNTPLELAQRYPDIVQFLRERDNLDKNLLVAARQGNLKRVKDLVEHGANVGSQDGDSGQRPIHVAAANGHLNVVRYFVDEKHADFNVRGNYGNTPLIWAANNGHLDIVRYFVDEKHADFNVRNNDNNTALHDAAANGHLDVVRYFVDEKHADFDAKGYDGNSVLHKAASNDRQEVARLLLDRGANVKAKNKGNKTPLDLADEYNNTEIIKLLVRKSAELDEVTPLHWAMKHRSLEIVNLFIEDDVNAKEENHGWTPLHFAAQENKKDIAELLIARNATIDTKNYRGWTPLHEAASKNSFNVTQLLVEKGADINARNNKGWTPLHEAAKKGNSDIVDFLIKTNGTNIEARSRNREDTPLHVAAEKGKLEVVKLLVNNTANVNAVNKYGRKPLDIARDKNHTDVTDFLALKPSRHRRDVSNEQEFSAASGSARTTSWINDYIAWIKDSASEFIGNIPFKRTTSLLTNNIQVDYGSSPKKQSTYESEDSTKTTISQIDFNGTIALLDLFVRRFTGEKYPSSFQGASLSQLEVLGYALSITHAFEKAIEQAAKGSGISMHRLNINFVEVQGEITKKVASGRFDEISGVLNSHVMKACSNIKSGKLSPKKFDRFITAFNNELPQIPYEKGRNISLSRANYIENQSFSLKDKNPSNYLEGVSVQGNLTQVKGV